MKLKRRRSPELARATTISRQVGDPPREDCRRGFVSGVVFSGANIPLQSVFVQRVRGGRFRSNRTAKIPRQRKDGLAPFFRRSVFADSACVAPRPLQHVSSRLGAKRTLNEYVVNVLNLEPSFSSCSSSRSEFSFIVQKACSKNAKLTKYHRMTVSGISIGS